MPSTHLQIALNHRVRAQKAAMKSKTQQIRDALAADEQVDALRIAARFFDRSDYTTIFKRGIDNNPGFYRQLGQDARSNYRGCAENPGAKI